MRDEQSILKVLRYLKTQFENRTAFQYEQLSTIVQSLQMVWLLMSQRVSVWQKICMREVFFNFRFFFLFFCIECITSVLGFAVNGAVIVLEETGLPVAQFLAVTLCKQKRREEEKEFYFLSSRSCTVFCSSSLPHSPISRKLILMRIIYGKLAFSNQLFFSREVVCS